MRRCSQLRTGQWWILTQVIGEELHVTIAAMSSCRRTRAIEGLCEELNATRTTHPGTELTLVYSTKSQRRLFDDNRTM